MSFARGTTFANRLSGGGNPTGYSESGGVVTLSNSVVIDGGGGASAGLTVNDSGGNGDVKLYEAGGAAILDGVGSVNFYVTGVGRAFTASDGFHPSSVYASALGRTSLPWGSLTLGDATAQVVLGHNGATDGMLTIKDPNGVANGAIRILDAAGVGRVSLTTLSDGVVLNCPTGGAIYFQHFSGTTSYLTSGGFFPGSTGKTLGSTAAAWNALTLGDGTAQVLLNHDGLTDGLLRVSDPNGVAGAGLNLLTAAGASGLSLLSTGYHITAGTGQALALRGGTGAALQLYDGSAVSRFLVEPTRCATVQTSGDVVHEFQNQWLSKLGIKSASQELTALSGASASTTNLVPAGCTILYVVARVTTLVTGATTFDVGDGTDVDRYGAAIAVAAGTTVDETDGTADPRSWSASAQDVTLTANGGNFTAGAVRITAFYLDPTAPTS